MEAAGLLSPGSLLYCPVTRDSEGPGWSHLSFALLCSVGGFCSDGSKEVRGGSG